MKEFQITGPNNQKIMELALTVNCNTWRAQFKLMTLILERRKYNEVPKLSIYTYIICTNYMRVYIKLRKETPV
jgi:hypothetical protein